MPRNSWEHGSISNEFQPTCGDLTDSGNRPHSPFNIPNPTTDGDSWLRSNIHCMPTQIPRNGTLRLIASAIARRRPELSSAAVDVKCPTPGSTTLVAFATAAGSGVI